jgi:hypothetical protein
MKGTAIGDFVKYRGSIIYSSYTMAGQVEYSH